MLEAVRQVTSLPGVRLAAIAVARGIDGTTLAGRLHRLLDRLDARIRCRGEPVFQPVDVAAILEASLLEFDVVAANGTWRPDDTGIAALRDRRVDLWLCFAAVPPQRPLHGISSLGVWGLEIGQRVGATNRWGGAMELVARSPVTMVSVIDYAAPGDGLLYRTFGATIMNSARRNRLGCLHKGVGLFRRMMEPLVHRRDRGHPAAPTAPVPEDYPALGAPTATAVGRLSWRLAWNVAYNQVRSLQWRDQWQLAYYFADAHEKDFRFDALRYLVPPGDRFWADPFAVEHDGRHFIFFEELPYNTRKGRIMGIEVFEDAAPGEPFVALDLPYHLSYPFVFAWEGTLYMLPETASNHTVEVYRCEDFPSRWKLHRVFLDDIRAYDPTLWCDGERWWLFVNVAESGADSSDELHIYWSPSPLGPWRPHRNNPVISDVRCARPAGPLFERDGMLYRPSQDCSLAYGHSVLINRVEVLREDEYRETAVQRIMPGWRRDILHVHTFGGSQRLRVIDYLVSRKRRS